MIVAESNCRPLGGGLVAPAGSIVDAGLAARLAAYKRWVAGAYESVAPTDLAARIPDGAHIVSEKVDGETWFLHAKDGETVLLSPAGRAIADVPLLKEAAGLLHGRQLLLAGELYAAASNGRPRVYDLASCLGGGSEAQIDQLRFAAFDVLMDGGDDAQLWPFARRADLLQELLSRGQQVHCVPFKRVDGPSGVAGEYRRIVADSGAEGIVVRCADGRILKIKPEIHIDAAVVGFAEGRDGMVTELLLALMRPGGRFHIIGRVYNGFSKDERRELSERLSPLVCKSAFRKATDHGTLYRIVRPEVVVEVKCNDLIASNAAGEPIRRMTLEYHETNGWAALRPMPLASMINTVFVRLREDKPVNTEALRLSQVTDLLPVEQAYEAVETQQLPASAILLREAHTKQTRNGTAVRKVVVWKTNKEAVDPLYPAYVALFTDFSPGRKDPLRTELSVASTYERIVGHAESWLSGTIKRGWKLAVRSAVDKDPTEAPGVIGEQKASPPSRQGNHDIKLGIAFARTSSPSLSLVVARMQALAPCGDLRIEKDSKGRELHYELTIGSAFVENARRIATLLNMVRAWKTAEVSINDELPNRHEIDDFLNMLAAVRKCWQFHRREGGDGLCPTKSALGCERIRLSPTFKAFEYSTDQTWYAVGRFNGSAVTLDKEALAAQLESQRNKLLPLCPLFCREEVLRRIDGLPGELDPCKDDHWATVYHRHTGEPAWIAPKGLPSLPYELSWRGLEHAAGGIRVSVDTGERDFGDREVRLARQRRVPKTRYADVCGQGAVVEAVRDLVELPLRHAELFDHVGVSGGRGLILHGPPGNGKTLLARAVAGETEAHIEIVSGPELLSKWLGESERALRTVFERARELAPAIILFDELDSIAGLRDEERGASSRLLVSQLLVLLDGLEERGRIFVIGTTNRPDDIDPALTRPGRFERLVFVGLPDESGRAAIFARHLAGMRVGEAVSVAALAAATGGLSGAQIEYVCRQAGLLCIKEAIAHGRPKDAVAVSQVHLEFAIKTLAEH